MSVSFKAQLVALRDWLFPRRCLRKQRWTSETVAKTVIRTRMASKRDRPKELHFYRCAECKGWHITRMKQPE